MNSYSQAVLGNFCPQCAPGPCPQHAPGPCPQRPPGPCPQRAPGHCPQHVAGPCPQRVPDNSPWLFGGNKALGKCLEPHPGLTAQLRAGHKMAYGRNHWERRTYMSHSGRFLQLGVAKRHGLSNWKCVPESDS